MVQETKKQMRKPGYTRTLWYITMKRWYLMLSGFTRIIDGLVIFCTFGLYNPQLTRLLLLEFMRWQVKINQQQQAKVKKALALLE